MNEVARAGAGAAAEEAAADEEAAVDLLERRQPLEVGRRDDLADPPAAAALALEAGHWDALFARRSCPIWSAAAQKL